MMCTLVGGAETVGKNSTFGRAVDTVGLLEFWVDTVCGGGNSVDGAAETEVGTCAFGGPAEAEVGTCAFGGAGCGER